MSLHSGEKQTEFLELILKVFLTDTLGLSSYVCTKSFILCKCFIFSLSYPNLYLVSEDFSTVHTIFILKCSSSW